MKVKKVMHFLAEYGADRKTLSLPAAHIAYLKALRKGTKNPIIQLSMQAALLMLLPLHRMLMPLFLHGIRAKKVAMHWLIFYLEKFLLPVICRLRFINPLMIFLHTIIIR